MAIFDSFLVRRGLAAAFGISVSQAKHSVEKEIVQYVSCAVKTPTQGAWPSLLRTQEDQARRNIIARLYQVDYYDLPIL